MQIAVPLSNGQLALHFGHCEKFAIIEVDLEKKIIMNSTELPAPAHAPGLLPSWLHEQGVNVVIAGGMGQRAKALFQAANIEVIIGAPAQEAKALVQNYLDNVLMTGPNICDH